MNREIRYFRAALGVYFLYYYLTLLPNWAELFTILHGALRVPALTNTAQLLLASPFVLWATLIAVFACAIGLAMNWKTQIAAPVLFALNTLYTHANPYLIHEPQPLAQALLLSYVFYCWFSAKRTRYPQLLAAFLGAYYLIAGVKKLIDPLWRSGDAVGYLLQWSPLAHAGLPTKVLSISALPVILTYATLCFELSFLFLIFTRARPILVVTGVLFHLLIWLTLEVGSFSALMLVWYAILLDERTLRAFEKIKKRICSLAL